MAEIIVDGTGRGYSWEVDVRNHAHVQSFTEESSVLEMLKTGGGYVLSTGQISVTSGASAIMFLKNGTINTYLIDALRVAAGVATSSNIKIEVLRNPTAGTIVSAASNVTGNGNTNFGSSNTLGDSFLAYKGANGNTFTDGTVIHEGLLTPAKQGDFDLKIGLFPGTSMGLRFTVTESMVVAARVDLTIINSDIFDI